MDSSADAAPPPGDPPAPPAGRARQPGRSSRARTLERETRAWDLSVQGYTQREIAETLGVSQVAVCKMLRRVQARLFERLTERAERTLVQQTARLEHLVRESLRAWAASQGEHTIRRQRKTETQRADGSAARSTNVVEVVVQQRYGDARLLREAREVAALLSVWHQPVVTRYYIRQLQDAAHAGRAAAPSPDLLQHCIQASQDNPEATAHILRLALTLYTPSGASNPAAPAAPPPAVEDVADIPPLPTGMPPREGACADTAPSEDRSAARRSAGRVDTAAAEPAITDPRDIEDAARTLRELVRDLDARDRFRRRRPP